MYTTLWNMIKNIMADFERFCLKHFLKKIHKKEKEIKKRGKNRPDRITPINSDDGIFIEMTAILTAWENRVNP